MQELTLTTRHYHSMISTFYLQQAFFFFLDVSSVVSILFGLVSFYQQLHRDEVAQDVDKHIAYVCICHDSKSPNKSYPNLNMDSYLHILVNCLIIVEIAILHLRALMSKKNCILYPC